MDKYDKEIFAFLTTKENFEAMISINSQYNFV